MLRRGITVTGTKHRGSARKGRHPQQVAYRGNWPGAGRPPADEAATQGQQQQKQLSWSVVRANEQARHADVVPCVAASGGTPSCSQCRVRLALS